MGSTTTLTPHEADATASHFRDTDSFRPHPYAADAAGQQGSAVRPCLACQMALCLPTRLLSKPWEGYIPEERGNLIPSSLVHNVRHIPFYP
jgi:hypothetical protein